MYPTEVTFASGEHQMAGTFVAPNSSGPYPAALLVSGSGPIDRNSNARRLRIEVMRQVADRLAATGIASLRFDKRGVGSSSGNYLSAGFHDNVNDARAALDSLRARPEVASNCVSVIGHSEGALIATELAGSGAEIRGVVLLAGAATTGEAVLRRQATQVAASLPRPTRWLLRILRQDILRTQNKRLAQLKASTGNVIRVQLVRMNAKWFREFMVYDPAEALHRIAVPVLAVTGSKDIQVDPADVERMAKLVRSDFTGDVAADVTHLLRRDDGPPSLRTYKKQVRRPVDRRLLDTVASWAVDLAGNT